MDDFDPMDKFIMGDCGHYYCRDCALEYFKGSLNEFPIKVGRQQLRTPEHHPHSGPHEVPALRAASER